MSPVIRMTTFLELPGAEANLLPDEIGNHERGGVAARFGAAEVHARSSLGPEPGAYLERRRRRQYHREQGVTHNVHSSALRHFHEARPSARTMSS